MADLVSPATPQKFSFDSRDLFGFMVSFSGNNQRRHVVHEFLNRRGARIEDKEQAPIRLELQLEFLGDSCAKDYQAFKAAVAKKPTGLLVHPIAGRFNAFCLGPNESVNYSVALNEIRVQCAWIENELDGTTPRDVPDIGTQAQVATAWKTQMNKAIAAYMGAVALVDSKVGEVQSVIQAAVDSIDTLDDPIEGVRGAISGAVGVSSQVAGKLTAIQSKADVLSQTIDDYVSSATDLYNGADIQAGAADAADTLLGAVQAAAAESTAILIANSPSPAGAAEAVGNVEETAAACLLLGEAVIAARPPVIVYTVPELMNLVVLTQRRYGKNAAARADDIIGLNHIANPAAIPAGTRLRIPSR